MKKYIVLMMLLASPVYNFAGDRPGNAGLEYEFQVQENGQVVVTTAGSYGKRLAKNGDIALHGGYKKIFRGGGLFHYDENEELLRSAAKNTPSVQAAQPKPPVPATTEQSSVAAKLNTAGAASEQKNQDNGYFMFAYITRKRDVFFNNEAQGLGKFFVKVALYFNEYGRDEDIHRLPRDGDTGRVAWAHNFGPVTFYENERVLLLQKLNQYFLNIVPNNDSFYSVFQSYPTKRPSSKTARLLMAGSNKVPKCLTPQAGALTTVTSPKESHTVSSVEDDLRARIATLSTTSSVVKQGASSVAPLIVKEEPKEVAQVQLLVPKSSVPKSEAPAPVAQTQTKPISALNAIIAEENEKMAKDRAAAVAVLQQKKDEEKPGFVIPLPEDTSGLIAVEDEAPRDKSKDISALANAYMGNSSKSVYKKFVFNEKTGFLEYIKLENGMSRAPLVGDVACNGSVLDELIKFDPNNGICEFKDTDPKRTKDFMFERADEKIKRSLEPSTFVNETPSRRRGLNSFLPQIPVVLPPAFQQKVVTKLATEIVSSKQAASSKSVASNAAAQTPAPQAAAKTPVSQAAAKKKLNAGSTGGQYKK